MTMLKFSEDKKEALRIASRFLKEVGLYDLWIRYCYDLTTNKNWIEEPLRNITDILGKTCFTDYVLKHRASFLLRNVLDEYCTYELFGEFVKKEYPQYEIHEYSSGVISIDKERKRVYVNGFYKDNL